MTDIAQKTIGHCVLLFDAEHFADLKEAMFEASYWQQQGKVTGQAKGRGTTTFFCHNNQHCVLRHYRRGGLIGKVIRDTYLYTGLKNTRAWAEMQLLNWMGQQGLAVPTAMAAKINKKGFFYQADIILQKIPQATDVCNILLSAPLNVSIWQKIGACIRQLHQLQVFHHDLNIHNIMLDAQQKVWLIDFDKCSVRPGEAWKNDNLQRLKRSLLKEKSKHPDFHWQQADWQACIDGYAAQPVPR